MTSRSARCQSIANFRSDRSYLAGPIQAPIWGVGPSLSDLSHCIKGTPAVLRRCLQGTRLSITARDYFSWITSRRQAQFLADLYLS